MKKLRLLLALVVITQVFACGLSNTMYNARLYFKTASERPLNSNGKPTPQAVEEYTKAIKKCGIIITERKNGKQLEEALFIMARSLYLKGNSAFQAKDQFDNLIRLNPDGKYVPESYIYQAKVLRDINKAGEAYTLLEGFVRNPRFRKEHPRALLTMADFEIQDKDYIRAQYWLERIITDYKKTPEYREAYFLFGKNYYVQEDYERSLEEFSKLARVRNIGKDMRLDAYYYMGLNQYQLDSYESGIRSVNYVIKNEVRPEQLARAKVLRGNLLIGKGETDKGIAELEAVLKDYPRSQASSSAAYSLGDHYFYRLQDKVKALSYYNRVRSELPTGELVAKVQTKITAINQINQNTRLNSESNLQPFLDYYYIAADNYYDQLSLPDSSFVMYQRLIGERGTISARLDSLRIDLDSVGVRLDSLVTFTTSISPADSAVVDSSAVATRDSIDMQALVRLRNDLEISQTSLDNRIKGLVQVIERFDKEVIPFVRFCQANLYYKIERKDPEIADILSLMQRDYPENKYTNAIRMLYNDEKVRIIDPREEKLEHDLDLALGLDPTAPDSMLVLLRQISESGTAEMQRKANFRLAWFYAIEKADTTSARAYFDAVLKDTNAGEYATMTRNFFDGNKFLIYNDKPLADSSSAIPDSLRGAVPADSSAMSDSLATPEKTAEEDATPPITPELDQDNEPGASAPPIIKEEEKEALPPLMPDQPSEADRLE